MGSVLLVQVDSETKSFLSSDPHTRETLFREASTAQEAVFQLEENAAAMDGVVLGPHLEQPVQVAQQAHLLDPDLSVVVLSPPDRHPQIVHALQFALFIGEEVCCHPLEEARSLGAAVAEAVTRTQQRREYRATVRAMNAAAAIPSPFQAQAAQYLGRLLDHAPIGVVAVDDAGCVLAWNPKAGEIFGKSEREMLGRSMAPLFPEREQQKWRRLIEEGLSAPKKIPYEIIEREREEGTRQWVELRAAALASSIDYETTLLGLARLAVPYLADFCIVDLCEERQIRRVAVVHHDPEKEILLKELQRRYPPDSDSPQPAARAIATGEPELLEEVDEAVVAAHTRDTAHFDLIRRLDLRSHLAVPLIARGRTLGALSLGLTEPGRRYRPSDVVLARELARRAAFAVDHARLYREAQMELAERRRVEEALKEKTAEAEEANRLKSQFLSNVSHELRTPLNAIIGYNSLLIDGVYGALGSKSKEALEAVERNAKDLLKLINDILDLSRIEAGKLSIDRGPVRIRPLVEEIIADIRPLFEKKSLIVELKISEGLPTIESDAGKIRQILSNLLSNAVKFTRQGGITVHINKRPQTEGIEVAVEDTGIGIPDEERDNIFNPFHQVDGSSIRTFGGVGLGLTIVKELIGLLGGEIRVESEVGKGSTFTVSLPYRIAPE
ncbi:PAS domain-containing sensor histidine kinase [Candidatus Manganitrophus noduliformans]|uniref:histidine kinase n=1 Tax=Candidatus Manganitrophus noduliformans TaxID=2606439 RepID=A0A7X6DNP2_9BACT|nr:ATP-binding protein [Candidatus Manganitrophus noduliformans]NKE70457.1 PAS domain S-box protein [Candidatus Manganitrophus noduliformans]